MAEKNPLVQSIWDALDRTDEWVWTGYRLIHRPSGLDLWMSNGRSFFEVQVNGHGGLSLWRHRRLWKKACRTMDAVVAHEFNKRKESRHA